jgi:MinD superfamily P-loop ATPase
MKQLLILSGKGGTGKTTMATAFIKLANAKAFADCDVDAPNLHLLMHQSKPDSQKDFYGLPKAHIDKSLCVNCGKCMDYCRFDAIKKEDNQYLIDFYSCEGCGVCALVCPQDAISMAKDVAGDLLLYDHEVVFSTAKLKMGSGTSGRLVSEVKKQLKDKTDAVELAIVDGSPGIGCPVIASISGADLVLIVTEPTLSGISDMERIIATAKSFQMKMAVCVNKADTNNENTSHIQKYCEDKQIPFVGEVPFDKNIITALNEGKSIIDTDCEASQAIRNIYKNTMSYLVE